MLHLHPCEKKIDHQVYALQTLRVNDLTEIISYPLADKLYTSTYIKKLFTRKVYTSSRMLSTIELLWANLKRILQNVEQFVETRSPVRIYDDTLPRLHILVSYTSTMLPTSKDAVFCTVCILMLLHHVGSTPLINKDPLNVRRDAYKSTRTCVNILQFPYLCQIL